MSNNSNQLLGEMFETVRTMLNLKSGLLSLLLVIVIVFYLTIEQSCVPTKLAQPKVGPKRAGLQLSSYQVGLVFLK